MRLHGVALGNPANLENWNNKEIDKGDNYIKDQVPTIFRPLITQGLALININYTQCKFTIFVFVVNAE